MQVLGDNANGSEILRAPLETYVHLIYNSINSQPFFLHPR